MGKPTGFMDYNREDAEAFSVKERIQNYNEFHTPLSKRIRKSRAQDVWSAVFRSVRQVCRLAMHSPAVLLTILSLNGMTLFSKVVGNRHITDLKLQITSRSLPPVSALPFAKRLALAALTVMLLP